MFSKDVITEVEEMLAHIFHLCSSITLFSNMCVCLLILKKLIINIKNHPECDTLASLCKNDIIN